MGNAPKLILLDYCDNEISDSRLDDPRYMELGRERTERIAERHIAHTISIEDALAHAYLQGQFDVNMCDREYKGDKVKLAGRVSRKPNKKPAAKVTKPTGINPKRGTGKL